MIYVTSILLLLLGLSACSTSSTSDTSTGAGQQQSFSNHYSAKLKHAMELLKQRGWWGFVSRYLTGVVELQQRGRVNTGTGVMQADSRTVATQSTAWTASTFVHEAEHVRLQHQGRTVQQEAVAIKKQIEACRTLGCSSREINWLNSLIGAHGA